jgi:hypothetical protein
MWIRWEKATPFAATQAATAVVSNIHPHDWLSGFAEAVIR